MIDLGKLPRHQHESVFAAVRKVCIKRIGSSHLSKVGYSAREGWNFLKHYHELLIQCEETLGRPYLFLKAEGHTTGPSGIVPHLVSWAHKKWYGEGKTVSPDLNELALKSPELVSRRAAENYAVGYKALLKEVLHLKGKKVLVHELLAKLYSETGFKARTSISITSTSSEWGESLEQYCELATNPGPMRLTYTKDGKITPEMISDLRAIAKTLKSDPGDKLFPRVFEEIRTNASELDASISKFCEYQA